MSIQTTDASNGTRPMPAKQRPPFDRAKLVTKLRELEEEWRAFEDHLRAEEQKIWQPHWSYSESLIERLLRVGYPQETVCALKRHLDIIYGFLRGEPVSPDIRNDWHEIDAAEGTARETAMKQLAAIVIAGAPERKPLKWPRREYGVEASCISKPRQSLGYIRFVG